MPTHQMPLNQSDLFRAALTNLEHEHPETLERLLKLNRLEKFLTDRVRSAARRMETLRVQAPELTPAQLEEAVWPELCPPRMKATPGQPLSPAMERRLQRWRESLRPAISRLRREIR